jgi:hypothetical protein
MNTQRYVSEELTHFVGSDLMKKTPSSGKALRGREDRLYARLLKILAEGLLATGGKKTGVNADPAIGKEGLTVEHVFTYNVGSTDLARMFEAAVICFCDIPVGDVGIHMSKYSSFGLAFKREFLLKQGANPVMYLAEDSVISEGGQGQPAQTNGDLFLEEMNSALVLLSELQWAKQRPDGAPRFPDMADLPKQVSDDAMRAHQFLLIRMFSFVKAFRGDRSDEDPKNYYMEREWRRYGDLDFGLEDVCRVYIPRRFAKRLREDLPDYYGQVTFAT